MNEDHYTIISICLHYVQCARVRCSEFFVGSANSFNSNYYKNKSGKNVKNNYKTLI